jgi:hypothetical protein
MYTALPVTQTKLATGAACPREVQPSLIQKFGTQMVPIALKLKERRQVVARETEEEDNCQVAVCKRAKGTRLAQGNHVRGIRHC